MTKKVFLVADGEYSDYRVYAVFSDKGQANEFARLGGFDWIEEYPLDIEFKDPGYDTYEVEMKNDGSYVKKLPRIGINGLTVEKCILRTWKDTF